MINLKTAFNALCLRTRIMAVTGICTLLLFSIFATISLSSCAGQVCTWESAKSDIEFIKDPKNRYLDEPSDVLSFDYEKLKEAVRNQDAYFISRYTDKIIPQYRNYVLAQIYLFKKEDSVWKWPTRSHLEQAVRFIRENEDFFTERDPEMIYLLETEFDGKAVTATARAYEKERTEKAEKFKRISNRATAIFFVLSVVFLGSAFIMKKRLDKINGYLTGKEIL